MGARRSWREFRSALARYLALVALVVLGVGIVVGFAAGSLASLEGIVSARESGRLADGEFTTLAPLSDPQTDAVVALGVEVESAPTLDVRGDGRVVRVLPLPVDLNRPTLAWGRLPEASGEVVVEQLHAAARGLGAGDRLALAGRTFTVVGAGSLPHYSLSVPTPDAPVADPAGFGWALVTGTAFDALSDADPNAVVHGYAFRLEGATEGRLRAHLQGLAVDPDAVRNPLLARALRHAEAWDAPIRYPLLATFLPATDNLRVTSASDDALITTRVAAVAGVLMLGLVGFVLAAFSRDRITREGTVIGTLYALGFSRARVTRQYLGLPLAVTGAGASAGVVVGHLIAPALTGMSTGYYSQPALDFAPRWPVVAAALVVPVGLVAAVNLGVLREGLRQTPLALLRPQPSEGGASGLRLRGWPFGLAFRVRQAVRAAGSLALLAAGLMLSILLLVFGVGGRASVESYVAAAERATTAHHTYALQLPDLDRPPPDAHLAVALPMRVVGPGGDALLLGVDAGARHVAVDVEHLGPLDVAVSGDVAAKFGVGVGDPLTLQEAHGDLSWAFTVAAVGPGGDGLVAYTRREHATALLDPAQVAFIAALGSDGWLATGTPPPPRPQPAASGFYNAVLADAEVAFDPDRGVTHTSRADVLAGVRQFRGLMDTTTGTIVGAAALMAVLVLGVLTKMVIGRQRYAIALMKAFGWSDREVDRLYLDVYAVVVAGAVAVGLPVSHLVLGPVWRTMISNVSAGVPFVLPVPDAVVVAALVLVSYAVVRWASGRNLRRVPVTEVLKFRE